MKKRTWFFLVAAWGWLMTTPAPGNGSGFALEAGARGSALMGTMVARADDPSAIFYNLAGLVQLPGFPVMGGVSFIVPRTEIVTHLGGVDTHTLMDSHVCAVPIAPAEVVQRVFDRLAHRLVNAVGHQAVQAPAFVDFVEMRQRFAAGWKPAG